MDVQTARAYYRAFVRLGLRAVSYKAPQRYIYMDVLRRRFLHGDSHIDMEALDRTVNFMRAAADYNGMESRIIHTLIRTEYGRRQVYASPEPKTKSKHKTDRDYYETAYHNYQQVVANLNRTARLVL